MTGPRLIDGFMSACEMTGPLVLDIEDARDHSSIRVTLSQPFAVVGRSPASDIALDHEEVSRRHSYIQIIVGRVYVIDLASRTGLHWDNNAYGSGWLDRGRTLSIGPFNIRLRSGVPTLTARNRARHRSRDLPHEDSREHDKTSPQRPELKHRRLPRVTLEFPDRAIAQPPWRMNRMLTLIGRSPVCKVLLSGTEVSRFHCSLVRTPVGVWVVDLLTQKGIQVDNEPVRYHLLSESDELQVGHYRIRFRYGTPSGGFRDTPTPDTEALATLSDPDIPAAPVSPMTTSTIPPFLEPPSISSTWSSGPAVGREVPPPPPVPSIPLPRSGYARTPVPFNPPPAPDLYDRWAGQPPASPELIQSLLTPLVQQFQIMQQQMFDQFQNSLMMAFQMFATMHRDQMDLVREELAEIRRLSTELQNLQDELRREEEVPKKQEEQTVQNAEQQRPASLPQQGAATPAAPRTAPMPPKAPPTPPRPQPTPQEARAIDEQGRDLHSRLANRINALQNERQNRWQRLVNMVTGQSGKP